MENSTAIGTGAKATAGTSTAIGPQSQASGGGANAIGYQTQAGNSSNVIGYAAKAEAASNAIGYMAEAMGGNSTAVGHNAVGSGADSNAIGNSAEASGDDSIAIGRVSSASGTNSIAIGLFSTAVGTDNIAIGRNACVNARGNNKVCIGANSGPTSGLFTSASDTAERIFIGSQSKFNNGAAVLEIHNLSSRSLSALAYPNDTSVVINGNLIVRGSTFLTTRSQGSQDIASSNRLSLIERGPDDNATIRKSHNIRDKWPTFMNNLQIPDDITTGSSSDRRLKYVGKESTSGLDKIRQLKVFNYTFKKDEKKIPHVGVIAQDLQKVFPDAVKKGVDGFLTIRFEDMFFAMINAIKELDTRVTTLQKENQELTEILKQVQDDNKELNTVLKQVQNDNKELKNDNKKLDARLKVLEEKIK